jgi:Ni/Co efflux regulator RcnB
VAYRQIPGRRVRWQPLVRLGTPLRAWRRPRAHLHSREHLITRKIVLSALAALFLATSGPGFAQRDGDNRGRQREDRQDQRHDQGRRAWQEHDARARQHGGRDEVRRDERGAGPEHRLHRGDRLPPAYRHRSYVVDDWRGHRLSAPPRGSHWVQVGGDYVLASVATGVILQLLLSQ